MLLSLYIFLQTEEKEDDDEVFGKSLNKSKNENKKNRESHLKTPYLSACLKKPIRKPRLKRPFEKNEAERRREEPSKVSMLFYKVGIFVFFYDCSIFYIWIFLGENLCC